MTTSVRLLLKAGGCRRFFSSSAPYDPRVLATHLANAYVSGTLVPDAVVAAYPPPSLEDALAVQQDLLAQLLARLSGETLAGWKIGATSASVQALLQMDAPFYGGLLARNVVSTGGDLRPAYRVRGVEAEFAFRMARDLPFRDGDY